MRETSKWAHDVSPGQVKKDFKLTIGNYLIILSGKNLNLKFVLLLNCSTHYGDVELLGNLEEKMELLGNLEEKMELFDYVSLEAQIMEGVSIKVTWEQGKTTYLPTYLHSVKELREWDSILLILCGDIESNPGPPTTLKIGTLNVRGCNDYYKLKRLVNYMSCFANRGRMVYSLQETYIPVEALPKALWRGGVCPLTWSNQL